MTMPPPGPTLPTRQQLDEIDLLLKRMLALPPLATAADEPVPDLAVPTPPAPAIAGDPVVQAWRMEWGQAPPTSVVTWGAAVVPTQPAPEPRYAFYAAPAPAAPPAPPLYPVGYTPAPPLPVAARSSPAVAPVLWPLVAVNAIFDVPTYLFGSLGAWVRGPMRTLLGRTGVLMILGAAGWAVGEWYGYDWPRPEWLDRIDWSRLEWPK